MTTATLSPRPALFEDDLKLTDGRCVRWFLEGLEALKRFDDTVSPAALKEAEGFLSLCVEHYPKDMLPKFYLGVTRSILDDMSQDDAIKCFTEFVSSKNFEVRSAAKYNLACAYVETYDENNMQEGERVLTSLLQELREYGAPIGQPRIVRKLFAWLGSKKPRVEILYFLAKEVRSYLQIHLRLWIHRWKSSIDRGSELADKFSRDLRNRANELERNTRFLEGQAPEIWAWHWNNVGMVEESRAALELRSARTKAGDGAELKGQERIPAAGKRAKEAYTNALEHSPHWESARSNLARLLWEVFTDIEGAIAAYQTALEGVEDRDYNHYCIGILYTRLGRRREALNHFRQSPEMLHRRGQRATWIGAQKMLVQDLKKIGRRKEAIEVLHELLAEHPDDTDAADELSELLDAQENDPV